MFRRASSPTRAFIGALAAGLLVLWLYWPGLAGPLVLDDHPNLEPVARWLAEQTSLHAAIFDNRSGPLGRPLAMASFVADASLFGFDPWHFKLTNVLVHFGTGLLVFLLLQRLLPMDPSLGRHAHWLAPALALAWLLLPIQVSSVLYVVQRMALLAAFFMVASLLAFVVARAAIDRGQRWGHALLWIGVPMLTLLGAYSKENGVLALPLAAVIEWLYFRRGRWSGPRSVTLFFVAFVALPGAIALGFLAWKPEFLLAGYITRDFTLAERLLTQPRVLWDYVGSIVVPVTPGLGLFNDDYPVSTGWLRPWTTVPAILAWLGLVVAAASVRGRHPAILAGVLFFLVGHAVESSAWPLEIHFEHRNYLPALGVLLAVSGLAVALLERLPSPSAAFRRAAPILGLLLLAVLAWGTHARAVSWSSLEAFFAQAERASPNSPRLQSFLAGLAADRGDLAASLDHIARMEQGLSPSLAVVAPLWRVLAHCLTNQPQGPDLLDELERRAQGPIRSYAGVVWESLSQRLEAGPCPGLDESRFARIVSTWVLDNPVDRTWHDSWRPRMNLGRFLASRGDIELAAEIIDEAWRDSAWNRGLGVLNFQLHASLGDERRCTEILEILERSRGTGDLVFDRALDQFRTALEEGLGGGANQHPATPPVNPNSVKPAAEAPTGTAGSDGQDTAETAQQIENHGNR